jgi:hypothetical protein
VNGADFSLVLANVRFRVAELSNNTNVRVLCRTMEFLDRNGERVQRGRQTRTPNLEILTGYTLTGTASRQGSRDQANIEVTCTNFPDGPTTPGTAVTYPSILTARNGSYTFDEDGGAELRALGYYECDFVSKSDGTNPDSAFLTSTSTFVLRTPQYSLLPVVLRTGNVDASADEEVDFAGDVFTLAGVFGNIYGTPYDSGDVNGDRRVDDSDLTLTAANVGLDGPLDADHLVYGLGRDFSSDEIFPYSQLWWGFPGEGATYPLINRSRTRDFWPALSPDGSQIAFIGVTDRRGESTYGMYYLDVSRGRAVPARFPRGFDYELLAPSWSPDGSQVAFICTTRGDEAPELGEGYIFNNGDICIVNSDDPRGDTVYNLGVKSEIFPPAWLEYDAEPGAGYSPGYVIIYPDYDTGKLYYYDLNAGVGGQVPVNAGSSDVLDLPTVVNYTHSATVDGVTNALSIDTFLAYRFSDGGDPYLKVGTITYDPVSGFGGGITSVVNGTDHVALEGTGTPDTTGVDYYDLSPSLDLVFYYEYNYAIDNTLAPFAFHIHNHDDANPLTAPLAWNVSAETYFVDSVVGNPIANLDGGSIYDPDGFGGTTELHANRMTLDWVP